MKISKIRRMLAFAICMVMLANQSLYADTIAETDEAQIVSGAEVVVAATEAGGTTEDTTTEITTTEAVTTETVHDVDYSGGERIVSFVVEGYLDDNVWIRWTADSRKSTGYVVYRKDNISNHYSVIAKGEPNGNNVATKFQDTKLAFGVTYTYLVQPYYEMDDGTVRYGYLSEPLEYVRAFTAPSLNSATRSNKKVTVKWTPLSGVNGYEIYRAKGSGSFKRVKRVTDATKKSVVINGNAVKSTYKYKMRAYIIFNGKYVYSSYSDVVMVDTKKNSVVVKKFKKLKKKYPGGYYWNHMGVANYNSTTITTTPCNHARYGYTFCNSYKCPTGYLGLQCYGFAWKMSDLIYGKTKKYTKHKKFSKARVGDVIRYNGHSVIITAKYSSYIVVGECNYGGTCIIKWGRKIYKSELSGATYFHRNL